MKKQLTLLSLLSLLTLGSPQLVCKSQKTEPLKQQEEIEDSWEAIFENMNQSMYRMQHKMAQDFNNHMQTVREMDEIFTTGPTLQFSSTNDALVIELTGLNSKDIDIKADAERCVIKTPEATIDITVNGEQLTAFLTQESKEETVKDGSKSMRNSFSQSVVSQPLRHMIDLSKTKAKIDEKECLTLTVPFTVKELTQSITIERTGK